jgi:hypothetical protein
MPWVKLDDKFHANPKLLEVGLDGTGLYARALSYCGAYLTDGYIPSAWVAAQIDPLAGDQATLPERLIEAGLWIKNGSGYRVHDYLALNPSRKVIEAERKRRADEGRKGANKRWHGSTHSTGDGSATGDPSGAPMGEGHRIPDAPEPEPDPLRVGFVGEGPPQPPPTPQQAASSPTADEPPGRERFACLYEYAGGVPCGQSFATEGELRAHELALDHRLGHEQKAEQ